MTTKLTKESTLPLPNSSLSIPCLGFGVYQSPADVCNKSCTTALSSGYRHIDTAQFYANETQVGEAVRNSGLKRSDVYITTKILSAGGSVDKSYQKCLDSVKKLDGEDGYVDLFLIHSPNAGKAAREEMWQALLRAHKEGKAKAIGVSNFGIGHIEGLKGLGDVWPPHVNQIELHPWCQQRDAVEYCHKNGIVVEAYCPLVRNQKADNETLVGLAKKYNKSTAQILIRWSLQKEWVTLPKSDTPSRIKENGDVFNFEISDEDMKALNDLDEGAGGAIVQAVTNS
ncbi:hypothetical protein LTR05_000874 [Lithohypha guttulata]|uniref:D-xylose reductase [NAD(P)H] n=1 Tax=Lithohypha guttulata TaxID=1690604 RepID=A0AAN7T565_9EURO|nr:hypothetical protein LTR05_000874 [Lithohypha guttulata]